MNDIAWCLPLGLEASCRYGVMAGHLVSPRKTEIPKYQYVSMPLHSSAKSFGTVTKAVMLD